MATFGSPPAARFLAKASLSGAAELPILRSLYSLATEIAWASRLSRARIIIGRGWLPCVTFPAVIR